jgi:hypothetical protein
VVAREPTYDDRHKQGAHSPHAYAREREVGGPE